MVSGLAAIRCQVGSILWKYHCFLLAKNWMSFDSQLEEDLDILSSLDKETLAQVAYHFLGMRSKRGWYDMDEYKREVLRELELQ